MSVEMKHVAGTNIVDVQASGKLTKEDYATFVPEFEKAIAEHGKIRILFQMHDFHGWEMGALWEDLKFDVKHFRDIERVAIVGETKWEKGMAMFCKPFTTAKIKYFDHSMAEDARAWIHEGSTKKEAEAKDTGSNNEVPPEIDARTADLVRVYTLHDAGLADIISNALRDEGIPCFVSDELQAAMTGIFEVDILVRATDADRARAFIKKHEEEHKVSI